MRLLLSICILLSAVQHSFGQADSEQTNGMSQLIDKHLNARLTEIGWQAGEQCTDASFLRRASLDLTGTPPTAAEVVEFVADVREDKRERLVDRLISSPACDAHLSDVWSSWLLPEMSNPQALAGQQGLQTWLRDRFAENLRYDRLVSDLLTASGPVDRGPTAFFVALEGKPEKIASKTARVFMGVQLDCAECHDHPFDEWSQKDFWSFAAYFAQITPDQGPAMGGGTVTDLSEGEVMLPGTDEVIAPRPIVNTGFSGLAAGTRRQKLTLWLTARENPFLAQATVNRVWAMLMGRGLIEPVDDMRSLEMASHPALLEELADTFASEGYNLKLLLSQIAKSEAYSRATTHISGQPPAESYATMATKPLTNKQLAASVRAVSRELAPEQSDNPAQAFFANNALLENQLGRLRGDASEAKLGIVSALVTLHGNSLDQVSREKSSRLLKALQAPYMNQSKQVKWLFLSTLNRQPTQEEEAAFSKLIGQAEAGDEETAPAWLSDLLWALLNSTEFAMTP